MPIPKPKSGEERNTFMSRCHSVLAGEYRDQSQRHAICLQSWRDRNKQNEMEHLSAVIDNLQMRTETFEGRVQVVVPVILLTEGVHHGSGGPTFYPADELSKFAASWNGIPVPVYHPKDEDGSPISCNDPGIVEEQSVGRLWNVRYENKALRGEIWIDDDKMNYIEPDLLPRIRRGDKIEVSTGLWGDNDYVEGEWRGEKYHTTIRNLRPDHLAILPEGEGACSWEDGCGIRTNKEEVEMNPDPLIKPFLVQANAFFHNELSHGAIRKGLQLHVDKLDGPNGTHFVEEIYDSYFIIARHKEGEPMKLYKQDYSVKDDKVELEEEMMEVQKDVNYTALESGDNFRKEGSSMDKTVKECCPDKVNTLIKNEKSPYKEEQREWLESLSEEQFGWVESPYIERKEDVKAPEINPSATDSEKKQVFVAEDRKAEEKKETTFDELLDNAPPEKKEMIEEGLRVLKARKTELIEGLAANKRNRFTKEQLGEMKLVQLENLALLADIKVDYSGKGGQGGPEINEEKVEALSVPTLEEQFADIIGK